ncbi:hypothetical protein [Candidatus Uabimicrobium sp. HlEnr_7]|uniref:hypothetical protein n=1 Tax=Candidatus Uabimicrobium helgolandensis TaxID=3095367 RepID=UPI0035569CC3
MKRLFVLIIFIVFCGCDTTKQPKNTLSTNIATSNNNEKTPLKKRSVLQTKPNKSILEERLPSQFYISGSTHISPGEKYTFDLHTRTKDTVQTIVYYVQTPIVFIDEVTSAKNPIISDTILASLSDALIKKNRQDLISYQKKNQIQTTASFDVVDIHETYEIDTSPGWINRQITLGSLAKPGMYLLETRIGPQAAYLVVTANTFTTTVRKYDNRTLVWITNPQGIGVGNVPLFYEDENGNSLQKRTNTSGVAILTSYSPWIVAWQKSQVAIIDNPQKRNHGIHLWLDKKVYAPGETIHIAWKHPLSPKTIARVISVHGNEIIRREISPQPSTTLTLPNNISSGKFIVQIENIEEEIIVADQTSTEKYHPQITTDKHAYKSGDIITVNVYGTNESEVKIDIYKQNEIIDRQIQISNNGVATCYLQLEKQGSYNIKSCGVTKTIYIDNETMVAEEAFPQQTTFKNNSAKILVPKNNNSSLYILQGSNSLYHVQPPQETGMWKDFAIKGNGRWQAQVFSPGKLENTFEFYVNNSINISLPSEIHAQQKIQVGVNFENSNYKYLLWATSGSNTNEQLPNVKTTQNLSDARNLPFLYKKWVRSKIKADYALAVVATSKKQYASAVYLCQQILKWDPQNQLAKNLLLKSISTMTTNTNKEYLSPKERLKYTYIGGLASTMTFQELVEKIEEQANVYIEVDPQVYQKYPEKTFTIAGLPSGENAFSLLSYFFITRSLTYKIEHGVLFITLQSQNILLDLLEQLDKEIDPQMEKLPKDPPQTNKYNDKHLRKTAFWTSWKSGQQKSTIYFPTQGMWTIKGILIDQKNKHYSFVRQVWVGDKLP